MAGKVKVYGKAQNRTALGIVHAYLVMYPHATLEDLRKAFPNTLNPDSGVKEMFLPLEEAEGFNTKMSLYFTRPDEVLDLADGLKGALAQVWSKPSFERIVEQGKLYDIEVAEFEKTAHPGQKGGYRLEYLNGYVPPVPEEKKSSRWWIWLLLALVAAGVALAIFLPRDKQVKEIVVEKEVVVRDTVYVQQIEEIERNFNAAKFAQGKSELTDDAKIALHDLARVLNRNPQLRLSIEGHTSSEGDDATNMRLSQNRARAAMEYLVTKEGVDSARLSATGFGSTRPVSDNFEENRRIEFIINDK